MKYLPILLVPCLLYAQEDPTFVKGATKKDVAIYNRDKDIDRLETEISNLKKEVLDLKLALKDKDLVIEKEKTSPTLCQFKLIETTGKLSSCETGQITQIVLGGLSVIGSGLAGASCLR